MANFLRRTLLLLAGVLAGVIGCYLLIDWRIGASEAKSNLYQVGAMQAYEQLGRCESRNTPKWAH